MLQAKPSSKSRVDVDVEALKNTHEFKTLARFFSKKKNFDLAESILSKKKRISLRLIEFVAANSSQFFFNLDSHGSFRDRLDALGKKSFDVFRRASRFEIQLGKKSVTTNLSQLRFFEHSIRSGVLQWLLESKDHVKKAERAMAEEALQKSKKPRGTRKKRKRELAAVGGSNVVFKF